MKFRNDQHHSTFSNEAKKQSLKSHRPIAALYSLTADKVTCTYLIINTLFILPMVIFDKVGDSLTNGVYLTMLSLYYIFLLPYIHIVFCIILLVCNIRKLVKDKKAVAFIIFLFIFAIDTFVNIYWCVNGIHLII